MAKQRALPKWRKGSIGMASLGAHVALLALFALTIRVLPRPPEATPIEVTLVRPSLRSAHPTEEAAEAGRDAYSAAR